MRYWHSSLRFALFVVACGMGAGILGCGKDPEVKIAAAPEKGPTLEKDAKAKEIAAKEQADQAAKDLKAAKDKEAKDLAAKKQPPKVDPVKEELPKETTVKETREKQEPKDLLPVTDPPGKETPAVVTEPKKDKKEKDKSTPTEPTEFGGKTFAYWKEKLKSADHGEREDAMKAVCMFGPNTSYGAVSEIIVQLNKPNVDLSVRVNGIVALSTIFKQTWQHRKDGPDKKHLEDSQLLYKKFLKDEQVIMRIRALQGLPWLGPVAVKEIDDVITQAKFLGTWEVRKEAILTLVILAQPDGSKDSKPNPKAISHLRGGVGSGILGNLNDPAYYVRAAATLGLATLEKKTGKVSSELYTKSLIDVVPDVRLTAMQALVNLKDDLNVKDTKPGALQALAKRAASEKLIGSEKNPTLRLWTHATILQIKGKTEGKDEDPHFDALLKGLKDSDHSIRATALTLIGSFGDKVPERAVTAILPLLEDKESAVAATALVTTVQIHYYPPVLAKLKEKSPEVRHHALQLISLAGPPAKNACCQEVLNVVNRAIPLAVDEKLAKAVQDQEIVVGEAAITTLGHLHCFEAVSYLEMVSKNKMVHDSLRDAAKDTVEDFKALKKEQDKKTK